MRLGDLDALKEEIVKLCELINANNGITVPTSAFTRIINDAPTVEQPQGKWIPVSEKLPEENGYYITTCRDIGENRVHTVGFDGVRKKWGRGGVIAWQPLPSLSFGQHS